MGPLGDSVTCQSLSTYQKLVTGTSIGVSTPYYYLRLICGSSRQVPVGSGWSDSLAIQILLSNIGVKPFHLSTEGEVEGVATQLCEHRCCDLLEIADVNSIAMCDDAPRRRYRWYYGHTWCLRCIGVDDFAIIYNCTSFGSIFGSMLHSYS